MSADELTIRPYRPEDAAFMAEVYAHYVRTSVATLDFEAPDLATTEAKYAAMIEKGHPVLIGDVDGERVGYAYASTYRPRPGYRFTCEDTIYLHPEHVGQGYGAALLLAVIEAARGAGFTQMLAVISDGVDASIGLHHKCGFEVLGRFPKLGHKFDRWVDLVHMQRSL